MNDGAHGGGGGGLNARVLGGLRIAMTSRRQGYDRDKLRARFRGVRLVTPGEVHAARGSGSRGHGGQHAKCSNCDLHRAETVSG